MTTGPTRRTALLAALGGAARLLAARPSMRLPLRSRVEAFKGGGVWHEVRVEREMPIIETAVLICDMWDNHWCSPAARRVDALTRIMAPFVDEARAAGLQIVHAPSDVTSFYKDSPQRRRALDAPKADPPAALDLSDPPLPIDDSDGGCESDGKSFKAWSRQHPAIKITGSDVVSDNGAEIYSVLRHQGIGNLLVMGVHTNMCVLNRTFAIRQMTRWGVRCVLVRDLTDSMYDPKDRPFVTHERGTDLVVEHIEKYWCPSVLSTEVRAALPHGNR